MPTIGFPLLLIPFAIYNIIVFLMRGVAFSAPVITLRLISGADWTISIGDMLVTLGIVLMLFEFARSSRPGAKYVMDHLLSLLVFAGSTAEFLWLTPFATSPFFLLVALAGLDFFSGSMWAVRYRKWVRDDARAAAEAVQAQAAQAAPVDSPPLERTPPAFEASAKHEDAKPKHLEIVTPEIDKPSEAPVVKAEAPKAEVDNIPDPEPSLPQAPSRTIAEWNVFDIVRGTDEQPSVAKQAEAGKDDTRPVIVPSKD
ncbi:MAG: hypothetical protein K2W78_09530 [Xanthobacteraceae bacterium]|nr:hypothetical protein [Xanthobacteraceae bacterium]